MKTLFPKFTLFSGIAACTVTIVFLTAPLILSAQHPNDMPSKDAMKDSMYQRFQRRMSDIGQRMDSLTDYLADLQPGDEGFAFFAPDLSMISDGVFFEDLNEHMPDFEELSEQFQNMPAMPEFDFQGDFYEGDGDAPCQKQFFRGNPGHMGVWVYIEKPDSLAGKSCKKIRKVMVLRGGSDTVMLEGNEKMVYTIVDDNGQITVKSDGMGGDTILTDSTRQYHFYGTRDGNPHQPFRYNVQRRAGRRGEAEPLMSDNFAFNSNDRGSARLSDLTADEISRLKRTDLKPGRKVVPMGVENLEASFLRRKQQLALRFDAPGEGALTIQLFDDQGSLIHDESLRKSNGRYDNRIALPERPSDELYLRISRGRQSIVKKLEL
ncbi:MAG TPA: hypothetical protein DCR43_04850 [Bacteroidales bacterium]|nr:MAG: hypothetical protein A2X11_01765 [Bacteroidetes bacterium GWE2_42_24]OFY29710.1 MAG: hypothetical protein A2X09_01405 [Bacteroidetes bacterium GWF2_43_11]HAQ65168.1 hypothetical protein [Bacteroidales bacterium]HBZ65827.1 hypothetical protein [Bacteroidales bacterium]